MLPATLSIGLGLLMLASADGAADGDVSRESPCAREMWIDLSEPLVSSDLDPAEALRRRERISAQQDEIAGRLRGLGIDEIARVQHVRNAILVRITSRQAEAIVQWAGVVGLRFADQLRPPVIDDDRPPDAH